MVIELPVVKSGISIGHVDIRKNSIDVSKANLIKFACISNVDCCSNLKIPVTKQDINRIEEAGYELDQIIDSLSPMILPSKTPYGSTEKVYALKRKPFDGSCTFLNSETRLCNIHETKPFACKIYPFSLDILNESKINIIIHSERLCEAIVPADSKTANNQNILENLLKMIIEELDYRGIPI